MKWAVLAVRFFVGISFVFTGASFFLMPPMDPPADENARHFIGSMAVTHYFDVIKVLEVVGGVLLLSGRLAPLGLVVLVPITVNIALWDVFMAHFRPAPAGLILLALELFVMWGYRSYFAPFFRADAKPG